MQNDPGDETPSEWGIVPNKPRLRKDWSVDEVIAAGCCPWCRGDVRVDWKTGALVCPKCLSGKKYSERGIFYTSPDACGVTVDPTKGED